ncbi:MAG: DNA polymerase III subunit [Planctomycetota bacterium]
MLPFKAREFVYQGTLVWQGIEGHDEVVEQFRRSLASDRLASTYLFVGPEGVGKRSFAAQLAKCLLCKERPDVELTACDRCESCRLIDAGNHPDLDLVERPDGKRYLPVDLFLGDREHRHREGLCHNIALRPLISSRRVAIIDDADWFTPESANCLLKTLEEPPPRAVILLIGTSRSRQLPTILSRSQVVRFRPLGEEVVQQIVLRQRIVDDGDAAQRIAVASHGSVAEARSAVGDDHDALRGRVNRLLRGGPIDVASQSADLRHFIESAGKDAESRRRQFRLVIREASQSLRVELRDLVAQRAPVDAVVAALEHCLEAEEHLDRNANQATLLETWVSRLEAELDGGLGPLSN